MFEELANATPREVAQLDALRALITQLTSARKVPDRVEIYCYRDEYGAPRINEISCVWDKSGASWQASNLDCFPVIFAAERYMLDCLTEVLDIGDDQNYDAEQEARRGLIYWLMETPEYNALPSWEERTHNPLSTEGGTP